MAKSTGFANAQLAALGQATSLEAQLWVSLHTGNPGTTGASEVSGGSYARIRVFQDETTEPYWDTPASGAMTHAGAITFPEGGGDASVSHVGLFDAETEGNFVMGGALDSGFTYTSSTTPEFAEGALEMTEE